MLVQAYLLVYAHTINCISNNITYTIGGVIEDYFDFLVQKCFCVSTYSCNYQYYGNDEKNVVKRQSNKINHNSRLSEYNW